MRDHKTRARLRLEAHLSTLAATRNDTTAASTASASSVAPVHRERDATTMSIIASRPAQGDATSASTIPASLACRDGITAMMLTSASDSANSGTIMKTTTPIDALGLVRRNTAHANPSELASHQGINVAAPSNPFGPPTDGQQPPSSPLYTPTSLLYYHGWSGSLPAEPLRHADSEAPLSSAAPCQVNPAPESFDGHHQDSQTPSTAQSTPAFPPGEGSATPLESLASKARRGLRTPRRRWTAAEDARLKQLPDLSKHTIEAISIEIDRTPVAIRLRLSQLGIKSATRRNRVPWNDEEYEQMRALRESGLSWEEIGLELERPAKACEKRWNDIELQRSRVGEELMRPEVPNREAEDKRRKVNAFSAALAS